MAEQSLDDIGNSSRSKIYSHKKEVQVKVSRQASGKHAELKVASELIGLGLEVFFPFVDISGTDLLVRLEREGKAEHYDIQVKSVKGHGLALGLPSKKVEAKGNNFILVLVFLHEAKQDEFYYLTREQLLEILPTDAKWGDIPFGKDRREQFKGQDLKGLIQMLTSGDLLAV